MMQGTPEGRFDIAALRRRLSGTRGRQYWRSLDEVAGSPEFAAWLDDEFPGLAGTLAPSLDRRRFLQVMAASFALAGLSGCGPEPDLRYLVPRIEAPEGVIPGLPRHFASATTLGGYATGVLVTHVDGRPIKIEGNPSHPTSLGATSAWGQASILGLYDPDRSQTVVTGGRASSWEALVSALTERRQTLQETGGKGLSLLTGTVTSPTLAAQLADLRRIFPASHWHQWEPINRDAVRAGSIIAFDKPLEAVPDLEAADVILAIESDVLCSAPGHLRHARHFAARRRAAEVGARMSRVYAIESTPTLIGAMADHRFLLRPDGVTLALFAIAGALGAIPDQGYAGAAPAWAAAVAHDLAQHRGRALVHVGRDQPAETHALAHLLNETLGAAGASVRHIDPVAEEPGDQLRSLGDLGAAMERGEVDTLLILGANPVFTAPADLGFAEALKRVAFSLHLGTHFDETAAACSWHVPQAHEYETWSDARAFDGSVTILQPQVRPLYGGKSIHQVLSLLQGQLSAEPYDLVRAFWQGRPAMQGGGDFAAFWTNSLREGVVEDSAAKPVPAKTRGDLAGRLRPPAAAPDKTLAILFRPDPAVWDGCFANNGWLQEMPRPHSTLTWDNAAMMAPTTASELALQNQDIIELRDDREGVRAPVLVLPGIAPGCIVLPVGQGRSKGGSVATGVGFNAYPLRRSDGMSQRGGIAIRKREGIWRLALRQHHQMMAGRPIVRT
ncbi:MAG: TAT-variant-translocated molybdopterin oxidoreductase, partial [Alphaproteobacteria bacterium]|nr:TAT-variant-translocated molybdopterin oxidoreductase [Alphaproteobacteria bacterium]